MMAPKSHIVIHHSKTKDGMVVDFSGIEKFHTSYRIDGVIVSREEFNVRKTRGAGLNFVEPWRAIGYHVVLENIGGKVQALFGRMPDEKGAHCPDIGMNTRGIGICCVGDFDAEAPSLEMWAKAVEVSKYFMRTYEIKPGAVIGHREAQEEEGGTPPEMRKTCPGLKFDMLAFRKAVSDEI